jgi:hypothetical protein
MPQRDAHLNAGEIQTYLELPSARNGDSNDIGGGFGVVLNFPLPSVTTAEEEHAFKRKFITAESDYNKLLRDALNSPYLKQHASISCEPSLASMRAAIIEIFQSFFATLGNTAHCEVFEFTSVDCDELFLCVKMSDDLAEILADRGEYPVQLSREGLEKLGIKLTTGDVVPTFCKYDKFMKDENLLQMHEKVIEPGAYALFRQMDRIRLLFSSLGDYIDMPGLVNKGLLKQAFPAHNKYVLNKLRDEWASFRHIFKMTQPIDMIREYYGEEVAFYFLFLMTIVRALVFLSFPAGFCGTLIVLGYVNLGKFIFNFTCFIWFNGLVKHWSRTEATYALLWGVDREQERSLIRDPINPDFNGVPSPWVLNENEMRLQPNKAVRTRAYALSIVFTLIYLCLVLVAGVLNQWWAIHLDKTKPPDEPQTLTNSYKLAALCLSVQIQVIDFIWYYIAGWLTGREEHLTMQGVNQSKAMKTFVVQFVNTFNVFVVLTYFKPAFDRESCEPAGGCEALLEENLVVTFACYISFGIVGLTIPFMIMKWRIFQEARELRKQKKEDDDLSLSLLEVQAKMEPYNGETLNDDYVGAIFPLAFIALFGAVMPFIVLLCLFGIAVQLRAVAIKLTSVMNRPFPARASGIGVWKTVMTGLSYIAIFNNIGLLLTQIHVEEFLPWLTGHSKWVAFLALQNIFVVIKLLFDALVADVPSKVLLEQSRQSVQRLHLFDRQDEDFNVDIKVECSGTEARRTSYREVPRLKRGSQMFVEPLA